jgi:hypothetical protein
MVVETAKEPAEIYFTNICDAVYTVIGARLLSLITSHDKMDRWFSLITVYISDYNLMESSVFIFLGGLAIQP